jgi:hypothetical protein
VAGYVSGYVRVTGRIMLLLAAYFEDGCISIHCDTL